MTTKVILNKQYNVLNNIFATIT